MKIKNLSYSKHYELLNDDNFKKIAYHQHMLVCNKIRILHCLQHLSQILTEAEGIIEHTLEKTEVETVFHR